MLKLLSKTGIVKGKQKVVFNYISDFRNFGNLLPSDRLRDIVLTGDTLRFGIDGLGTVGLKIAEKHPDNQLIIKAIEGTAADFTFWINIALAPENTSRVDIELQANLNMFLEMMAKEPLQKFVDLMVDKLQTVEFENHKPA